MQLNDSAMHMDKRGLEYPQLTDDTSAPSGQNDNVEVPTYATPSRDVFDTLADEVQSCSRDAVIRIGNALLQAKKQLHGHFLRFLSDRRVRLSIRTAQLYMQVALAVDGRWLASCGIAKAALLLPLPLAERQRLAELKDPDILIMSVAQLRSFLRQHSTAHNRAGCESHERRSSYTRGFKSSRTRHHHMYSGKLAMDPELAWAFGVLHLKLGAVTEATIDEAYKALCRLLHPDGKDGLSSGYMANLNHARDLVRSTVRNPASRVEDLLQGLRVVCNRVA